MCEGRTAKPVQNLFQWGDDAGEVKARGCYTDEADCEALTERGGRQKETQEAHAQNGTEDQKAVGQQEGCLARHQSNSCRCG